MIAVHSSTAPDADLGPSAAWVAALADFERATRTGEAFVAPSVGGPDGLGPLPAELHAHAERLLAACMARVEAVQAEMDEVQGEIGGLRRRSPGGGSWTSDARGQASGAGHVV